MSLPRPWRAPVRGDVVIAVNCFAVVDFSNVHLPCNVDFVVFRIFVVYGCVMFFTVLKLCKLCVVCCLFSIVCVWLF